MTKSNGIHHAVRVYGTNWCGDTTRAREFLDRLGVEYNYYDVEQDAAMNRTMMALQNGGQKTPVIDMEDSVILVEPSNGEIQTALEQTGRLVPAGR